MALKLYERYPQLWESPSNDYPQGAFKNLSAQGETDGSYLEQDWLNDYSGFFGALLRNAEMTPDGTIDTAQRSQFYDALVKVAKESVDLSAYRKKDDLLFKGMLKVQATDGVGASVSLQDTDGTVRGQVVATDQGLSLAQYPQDGTSQTFTFPSEGGEVVTDENLAQEQGQDTNKVMSQKAVTDFVGDAVPVGAVQAFIGETAPNDKWLLCRGQAFSAESYPDLAQLLPDLKIPDLRGVALRGLDANRGFDPDRALLSYQEDAMQKISGGLSIKNGDSPTDSSIGAVFGNGSFSHQSSSASPVAIGTGSFKYLPQGTPYNINFDSSKVTRTNTQNETVMKNIAVNFIIKAR